MRVQLFWKKDGMAWPLNLEDHLFATYSSDQRNDLENHVKDDWQRAYLTKGIQKKRRQSTESTVCWQKRETAGVGTLNGALQAIARLLYNELK